MARRIDDDDIPWRAYMHDEGGVWRSDEEMARDGWTPVVESRITLDSLAAAWEAAEQADTCNAGDVLITRYAREGSFEIGPAKSRRCINSGATRILSRAPREPWQDLADVLRREFPEGNQTAMPRVAKQMHAEGWRKGGDES